MAVASGPREVTLYSESAQFRFTPPVEVLGAGSGEVVGHLGPDQLHLEVAPRIVLRGRRGLSGSLARRAGQPRLLHELPLGAPARAPPVPLLGVGEVLGRAIVAASAPHYVLSSGALPSARFLAPARLNEVMY
jgi:hypothetical protein